MGRRLATAYLLLQSIAIVVWWIAIVSVPEVRSTFAMHEAPRAALDAFIAGDLGIIALGSALVAIQPDRAWSVPLAYTVFGASAHASLYCVTAVIMGAAFPWGALLMVPSSIATLASAISISRHASASGFSSGTRA